MTIKKYKENEEDYIYFKILLEDACRVLSYQRFVEENLLHNPKALKVFSRMMFLIKPKGADEEKHYQIIQEDIIRNVTTFLTRPRMTYKFYFEVEEKEEFDIPNFKFEDSKSVNNKSKKNKKSVKILSLENMLRQAVKIAIKCFKNKSSKEECITSCYKYIDDYTNKDKRIRKLYSHYKINVIAGYISWKMGFEIGKSLRSIELEKRLPTVDQINVAVSHSTKAYRTYPKK